MIAFDRDALICDFAETYHIYDYRGLPARFAAVLAVGLGDDSRIKRKQRGESVYTNTLLLASIHDTLTQIFWNGEGDSPKPLVDILLGKTEDVSEGYDTIEDYEAARRRIIGRG